MKEAVILWPPIVVAYDDEFGPIEPAVYQSARELWPPAEKLALSAFSDSAAGMQLMIKAAANVSRVLENSDQGIENLRAYLWKTYKNLVLAELEKINGRRRLEQEKAAEQGQRISYNAENLDKKILFEQICSRMDEWMRRVTELRALDYTFEMMESELGMKANFIRSKYDKRLKKLKQQIEDETRAAQQRAFESS
jgi:hypothetical protein